MQMHREQCAWEAGETRRVVQTKPVVVARLFSRASTWFFFQSNPPWPRGDLPQLSTQHATRWSYNLELAKG